MTHVLTGLDIFRDEYWHRLKNHRLGLLSNQASLDQQLIPAKMVIAQRLPGQLKALFGPQHGHRGEDQDNMVETDHMMDEDLNIPVFSLYAQNRRPLPEMLDPIDTLIIDLQDVGTRVYTFASTMLNCLKAAAECGKRVVVFDRPNPLGGDRVEGNLLKEDLFSFVGPFRYPMRHGLTMAEMARMFQDQYKLKVDLDIVPLKGWRREMLWVHTGLRWIMPSPNMPLPETAYVYPGQVIWEGTNVSEGRGTCRPFEISGAPFLDTQKILGALSPEVLQGCHLQEMSFRPTFHKWGGEICKGFMIHILDPLKYAPYFTSLALLRAVMKVHGGQFQWKPPPYEYEFEKMPIDLILGDSELRHDIESGKDLWEMKNARLSDADEFMEWRKPYLIY